MTGGKVFMGDTKNFRALYQRRLSNKYKHRKRSRVVDDHADIEELLLRESPGLTTDQQLKEFLIQQDKVVDFGSSILYRKYVKGENIS